MGRRFVVTFDAPAASDAGTVGGKAAGLGRLVAAGFPVPLGACLTVAAYELAFGAYGRRLARALRELDPNDPSTATDVAQHVGGLLADLSVPTAVRDELRDVVATRDDGTPFAVRSSATAEDQADASFAGQYATVLGVRGEHALLDAIVACWRSFFSANALAARAAYGTLERSDAMAVIVQPMIDAECAGVAFSVDPVRLRRDIIVVESAWGLGVGTVDGTMATDTARVHRPSMTIDELHVVEKPHRITLAPDGGTRMAEVDDDRRRAACLSEAWLVRVARFAVAAEQALGRPQDVEWAIVDGRLWLLQSRPLTALPSDMVTLAPFPVTWDEPDDARLAWVLSETSRHAVPHPLDHDLFDAFSEAVLDAQTFRGDAPFPNARLRIVNGRRYLTPVPGPQPERDVRVRARAMSDLYRRLLQQHGLTAWDYWGPEVITATKRLADTDTVALDDAGLAEHFEDALATFRRHWMVHWMLWPPPLEEFMAAYAVLTGEGARSGPDGLPPLDEAAATRLAPLLEGDETPLTRLIDGLHELGAEARAVPAVAELVREADGAALEQLRTTPEGVAGAAPFVARLERFLIDHGGRTGYGFGSLVDLRDPTWREDPTRVLALVVPYLDDAVEAPSLARERVRAQRDAAIDALCDGRDAATVSEFRRQLALARREQTVLEEHNHYIDQLSTAQFRTAVMACGRRLAERRVIARPDDAYWLHADEIIAALADVASAPLHGRVDGRREEHTRWSALEAPPVLGVPSPELPPRPPFGDEVTHERSGSATVLAGTAASPGRHRGRARVVTGAVALPDVQPGDVLVAVNAGPLWTPIFPILGAIVLDQGVLTQHSAVTAREYGIPAVVGTRNATRRIVDGSWIVVDGGEGLVEIEIAAELGDLPKSA